MGYENSVSREKKTLGYKERCDHKREAYQQQLTTEKYRRKSLVFIDESGFQSESFRRYGYVQKGEPVQDLISSQRTRTTTLVAARKENVFTAHTLFEGSCNAELFNRWLECELCPHLGADHLVIMDNARIHRTQRTKELIEATKASLLYLPPYSPNYDPIEHDFANIKRLREYNKDKTLVKILLICRTYANSIRKQCFSLKKS